MLLGPEPGLTLIPQPLWSHWGRVGSCWTQVLPLASSSLCIKGFFGCWFRSSLWGPRIHQASLHGASYVATTPQLQFLNSRYFHVQHSCCILGPFEDEKLCREEQYPVVINIIKSNFSHCPKETPTSRKKHLPHSPRRWPAHPVQPHLLSLFFPPCAALDLIVLFYLSK